MAKSSFGDKNTETAVGGHFVCGIRPKLTREPLNHARNILEQVLSILADFFKMAAGRPFYSDLAQYQ